MQEQLAHTNFSNVQLELLKLYSTDIQESELLDIKDYLSKYFAQKAISQANIIWDAKGFDNKEELKAPKTPPHL